MSNEQTSTVNIPARKVGAVSEKATNTTTDTERSPDVAGSRSDAARRRVESLAKAREAKRMKNSQKTNEPATPASEPDVDTDALGDHDDDTSDVDPVPSVPVTTRNVPTKKRTRELISALFDSLEKQDDPEEPPIKKPRTTAKAPDDFSLRNFVLDKVIDVGRIAVASGVASVGIVVLKTIVGGHVQNADSGGKIDPQFFK